ncbi:hypothetical protein ACLBOM_31690 [Escherichia coli]
MHMKYAISSFNVPSTQMAAATFVLEGHYHRHIRRMRQSYQRNLALYTCWIRKIFLRNLYYAPERRIFTVDRIA